MAKIEETVQKLLEDIINNLGYELYDIEYVKEGKDYFLRIYIDNNKGIDLNDCEKVSNSVTQTLDEIDVIKEQYFLEVSSPGIERILKKDKHLQSNIGSQVQIKLFKSQDKSKEYFGILKSFNDTLLTIENEKKETQIERKNIAQIKTVYEW